MEQSMHELSVAPFAQAVSSKISVEHAKEWVKGFSMPYRELMTYYHCALMEVETKFKVLNEDFAIKCNRNPIETIKTRMKTPDSIVDKMLRRNHSLSVNSIEANIHDIAGIRVICSFQADIYMLAEALLSQDDVTLIQEKDYIKAPKPNGYRSLHLIIAVPIFLHNEKRMMKVEVQFRTLAMDVWASLEHKIHYKKHHLADEESISQKLLHCAEMTAEIDKQMEAMRMQMDDLNTKEACLKCR